MYSHFVDEHIKGHHKYIATPEDPATSLKNESVYHFIVRSCIGSHVNVWNREVKRIKKEQGDNVPFTIVLINNKMTLFFLIHFTIVSSIYYFLGWESLKF